MKAVTQQKRLQTVKQSVKGRDNLLLCWKQRGHFPAATPRDHRELHVHASAGKITTHPLHTITHISDAHPRLKTPGATRTLPGVTPAQLRDLGRNI